MAKVGIYPVEFTASIRLFLVTKTEVTIDTFALGLRFDPGTTYTVELEEGFVKETGANKFDSPAVGNLSQFTTNSTGPQVQVDEPQDGGTAVTNNTFIRYTYDRQILAGNDNYYLYRETGSPDEEVAVYNPSDSTANCVISGNQITLDTTGLIDAGETYYVLIDEGAVEDKDGLPAFGFDNDQEHRWTTAASTNVDFPDLTSLQVAPATLSCEVTKNPNYEYGESLKAGTFTFVLTGDPIYKAISNMFNPRSFTRDTGTEIFSTNTPQIDEPPTSTNLEYTIEFSTPNGEWGDTDDLNTSYSTYSFTGTLAQCNAQFEKIIFYPDASVSAGASFNFTYTQKKDNLVTQLTRSVTLNNANNAIDSAVTYTYIETPGTYTPTVVQSKYKQFEWVAVGGGGGGAGISALYNGNVTQNTILGAGGGGGEVKTSVGNDYGVTGTGPYAFSNTTILTTIGAGGSLGGTGQSGGNGGTTTLVLNGTTTITCAGGQGGQCSGTTSNNIGGNEGGGRYNGGIQGRGEFTSYISGGAGAGAGDGWMDQASEYNPVGVPGGLPDSTFVNGVNGNFGQNGGYGWNYSYDWELQFNVAITNWGNRDQFGAGGGSGHQFGGGHIWAGDNDEEFGTTGYYINPNNNVRYYNSPRVDAGDSSYPDAGGIIKPRGQGGGGSGKDQFSTNMVPGHEGLAGCVALKIS